MSSSPQLKRMISLPFLILYGLGTMVGGGIYALLGKVAQEAGMFTPIAIAFSGLLAFISALSFSELAARFPVSAGEAYYVTKGFGKKSLGTCIGWLVVTTGVVSAATLSVATIGFLRDFVQIPAPLGVVLLVLAMGLVAAWGISQSIGVITLISIIEIGALFYVVGINGDHLGQLNDRWGELVPTATSTVWIGIFTGAFIAFYAFIGFEDLVNLAEEVKSVRRNMPIAILVCLLLSTLLYILVSLVAVLTVPPEELGKSATPLARIVDDEGWLSSTGLGIVSLLSGINGALVQIIMAARVAYGMAAKDQGPVWFAAIHPRTNTPLRATVVMTAIVLVLALFFPLTTLAKVTSSIILIIFASVNLALWRIKKKEPSTLHEENVFCVPYWFPIAGFIACLLTLLFQLWNTILK